MTWKARQGNAAHRSIATFLCILSLGTTPLQGQEPEPDRQLEELLRSDDPVLRGEAAIALSLRGQSGLHRPLLEVAKDKAVEARIRGILAVGILAAPGSEDFLGSILEESALGSAEHATAALALGALPEEQPTPSIDAYLAEAIGGSPRRHGPSLSALVYGLSLSPHPSRRRILETLMDDASNRDAVLRGLTVRAMGKISPALIREKLAVFLRDRSAEARQACLDEIRIQDLSLENQGYDLIADLARNDKDTSTRVAAIEVLIAHRRPIVLDIADRALQSGAPMEAAVAMRAILKLGGGAMRAAVERHLFEEDSPEPLSSMLREWTGQASDRFLDHCFALATDPRNPITLRAAAAIIVTDAEQDRIYPSLRRLISKLDDRDLLIKLLQRASERSGGKDYILGLYPESAEESLAFLRQMEAILAIHYELAEKLLSRAMQDGRFGSRYKAKLLSARNRQVLALPEAPLARLPKELALILQ